MEMNATYDYWTNALAGKFGAVHDGEPQPGFYRTKAGKAVAIWQDGDKMVAVEGGRSVDAADIWTWCCTWPVTEEAYRAVERGEGWPDAIETLIGSNNPPADEAEADEVENACKAALDAAAKPVTNQTEADKLGNHRDRLAKLYKAKEGERVAEKEPHLEAGRQVDAKFKPILAKVEDAGKAVKATLTKWLVAEQSRIDAENAAKAKAEREAREAAAAANLPPPEPAPVQEPEKPRAGTVGRASALRTFKSAVITDYAKALAAVANHAEVKELVQTLADRAARADIAMDGCEIKVEKRAA
jgi:hypothetical protein